MDSFKQLLRLAVSHKAQCLQLKAGLQAHMRRANGVVQIPETGVLQPQMVLQVMGQLFAPKTQLLNQGKAVQGIMELVGVGDVKTIGLLTPVPTVCLYFPEGYSLFESDWRSLNPEMMNPVAEVPSSPPAAVPSGNVVPPPPPVAAGVSIAPDGGAMTSPPKPPSVPGIPVVLPPPPGNGNTAPEIRNFASNIENSVVSPPLLSSIEQESQPKSPEPVKPAISANTVKPGAGLPHLPGVPLDLTRPPENLDDLETGEEEVEVSVAGDETPAPSHDEIEDLMKVGDEPALPVAQPSSIVDAVPPIPMVQPSSLFSLPQEDENSLDEQIQAIPQPQVQATPSTSQISPPPADLFKLDEELDISVQPHSPPIEKAEENWEISQFPGDQTGMNFEMEDGKSSQNMAPKENVVQKKEPLLKSSAPLVSSSIRASSLRIDFGIPGSEAPKSTHNSKLNEILQDMLARKASDLHLGCNEPITFREDGDIIKDTSRPVVTSQMMQELILPIMPERNIQELAETHDTDFAYEIPGVARFRVNLFRNRHGIGAVMRHIPQNVLTAKELGLSPTIINLCNLHKGLVLVTGPTGSGKSTTLAAMIDHINKTRPAHILTIEDPIEFVYQPDKCIINQREVGRHTKSFSKALRAALREDPDIVLVGEMRDLETIKIAIETAETGHLVFGTLHTNTAISTVDRIVDQFPSEQQQQIRVMLAEGLKGVISQTLLKRKEKGRVAAQEVLVVNRAIAALLREGKTQMLANQMTSSRAEGNILLNEVLLGLVINNVVTPMEAYVKSVDKTDFVAMLKAKGIALALEEKAS